MTIEFRGGRLPAQPGRPHLRLANYTAELAAPPAAIDWLSAVASWPMYLNDQLGDCTAAGVGHLIEGDTRYAQGTAVQISDDDVLHLYEATGGYNPADPSTDQGAVCQDVLDYMRKTGVAGHKVVAFAKVDLSNQTELRQAIALFGSVYAGLNFPDTAMTQFDQGQVWDVVRGARIEGGHCVTLGGYGPSGLSCVTWGKVQPLTWRFFQRYFEEAWVVITEDWLSSQGLTPTGLNLYQLGQDLAVLTGGPNPIPQPPQPQPVPVPPQPGPSPVADPDVVAAYHSLQAYAKRNGVA